MISKIYHQTFINIFVMKVRIILLLLVFGLLFDSCRDDKPIYDDAPDRERMTMLAWRDTGFTDTDAENGRTCGPLMPNKLYLVWYGIDGCAGYHVRIRLSVMGGTLGGADSWVPANQVQDFIVNDPNQLDLLLENLQYGTQYRIAIRTLSKKGVFPTKDNLWTAAYENDPYHSKWYGYGDANQRDHCFELATFARQGLPEIMTYSDRTETSVRLNFVLAWDDVIKTSGNEGFGKQPTDAAYIALNPYLELETGPDGRKRFVADYVELIPTTTSSPRPDDIPLTEADKTRGYIEVTGLTPNVQYIVNLVNRNVADNITQWDAYYNTQMIRMRGPIGEPIVIPHELYTAKPNAETGVVSNNEKVVEEFSKKHNACRIDEFILDFNNDTELAEGTVFLLEAGKTYFINNTVRISKGITLKGADPNNRSTVLMGGIFYDAYGENFLDYDQSRATGVRAYNFSFGRAAQSGEIGSITLSDIVIENINFQALNWYNYDNRSYIKNAGSGMPNYFINQDAQAMPFNAESFQLRNCDFQGMGRGFIRIQGASRKLIEKFIIDNCLIYNCGGYDDGGGGYPFISGDGTSHSNIFTDISITNTTFVNSPYGSIFGESANPNPWPTGYVWNVNFSNNTLINHNPRATERLIFNLQYPPAFSKFTAKKNLIVICPAKGESAEKYFCAGMRIRDHSGSGRGNVSFDIAENYSTNVFPGTATSIFNNYAFTEVSSGAGIDGGTRNVGGMAALYIEDGFNDGFPSLAPDELMVDPYPLGQLRSLLGYKHNVPDGLYFKNTPAVKSHPIYTKGIGAPRWREKVQ